MNNTANNWQRIDYIITEAGARLDLEWDDKECTAANVPAQEHNNTMRCYPVRVLDPGDPNRKRLMTEWWHKHRVSRFPNPTCRPIRAGIKRRPCSPLRIRRLPWLAVRRRRRAGESRAQDVEPVPRLVSGQDPGRAGGCRATLTVTRYLRGLHGDRLAPSGGTRTVTVPASLGTETVYDEDQFAGMVREEVIYNGVESKPVSKAVNVPWRSPATATRTINDVSATARFTKTRVSYAATALGVDGARGWRTTRSESWFSDTHGTLERTQNDGDVARPGDEKCTVHHYNRNLNKNLLLLVKQTTTTALPCGMNATRPEHVVSDTRTYYDGKNSLDALPERGEPTRTDTLSDWSPSGGTVWQTVGRTSYDEFGRINSTTDVRGNTTQTTYTPATGGLATAIATKSPAPYNRTTTNQIAPYWGTITKTTDQNNGTSETVYDPLGRVWREWKLGWSRAGREDTPSAEYSYELAPNRNSYPYVVTKVLNAAGRYVTSYHIADSLLRPRQTQTPGIGEGRVVTDTLYDEWGRVSATYQPHVERGNPSGTLWWEPEWSLPAVGRTVSTGPAARLPALPVRLWRGQPGRALADHHLLPGRPGEADAAGRQYTHHHGQRCPRSDRGASEHTTVAGVNGDYLSTWYTYDGKGQLPCRCRPQRMDLRVRREGPAVPGWTRTRVRAPTATTSTTSWSPALTPLATRCGVGITARVDKPELRKARRPDSCRPMAVRQPLHRLDGSRQGAARRGVRYWYEPARSMQIYLRQVGGFNERYQPDAAPPTRFPPIRYLPGGDRSYGYGDLA